MTPGRLLARAALWLCAGAGFEIQGRLLDRLIDRWSDGVAWLAWLQ